MPLTVRYSCVYILASKRNGTLYIGVAADLLRRVLQHKQDSIEGFTKRYGVHTLVYYEQAENIPAATQREKQLKKWKRARKINLIEQLNPRWRDLYGELIGEEPGFPRARE